MAHRETIGELYEQLNTLSRDFYGYLIDKFEETRSKKPLEKIMTVEASRWIRDLADTIPNKACKECDDQKAWNGECVDCKNGYTLARLLSVGVWYVDRVLGRTYYLPACFSGGLPADRKAKGLPELDIEVENEEGSIGHVVHVTERGNERERFFIFDDAEKDLAGVVAFEDREYGHRNILCFPHTRQIKPDQGRNYLVDYVVTVFLPIPGVLTPIFAEAVIAEALKFALEISNARSEFLDDAEAMGDFLTSETESRSVNKTRQDFLESASQALNEMIERSVASKDAHLVSTCYNWSALIGISRKSTDAVDDYLNVASYIDYERFYRQLALDYPDSTNAPMYSPRSNLLNIPIPILAGKIRVGTLILGLSQMEGILDDNKIHSIESSLIRVGKQFLFLRKQVRNKQPVEAKYEFAFERLFFRRLFEALLRGDRSIAIKDELRQAFSRSISHDTEVQEKIIIAWDNILLTLKSTLGNRLVGAAFEMVRKTVVSQSCYNKTLTCGPSDLERLEYALGFVLETDSGVNPGSCSWNKDLHGRLEGLRGDIEGSICLASLPFWKVSWKPVPLGLLISFWSIASQGNTDPDVSRMFYYDDGARVLETKVFRNKLKSIRHIAASRIEKLIKASDAFPSKYEADMLEKGIMLRKGRGTEFIIEESCPENIVRRGPQSRIIWDNAGQVAKRLINLLDSSFSEEMQCLEWAWLRPVLFDKKPVHWISFGGNKFEETASYLRRMRKKALGNKAEAVGKLERFIEKRLPEIEEIKLKEKEKENDKMSRDRNVVFRWLHLSDLHAGRSGDQIWGNVEGEIKKYLNRLHEKVGPWDAVIFSGDLVNSGDPECFKKLDTKLTSLWDYFQSLGFNPFLVTVPGNHDLKWQDYNNPNVAKFIREYHINRTLRDEFWENPDSQFRKLISEAFGEYKSWEKRRSFPKVVDVQSGLLPGDFSCFIEKNGKRLGIVGLNSAFLQLVDGKSLPAEPEWENKKPFMKRLALDLRQLNAVGGDEGPNWANKNVDAALLVTHHPDTWLQPKNHDEQYLQEIHRTKRFIGHACGHMHKPFLKEVSEGGAQPRRLFQSTSLFGTENKYDDQIRRHGFNLYELTIGEDSGKYCCYPVAWKKNLLSKEYRFVEDTENFDLQDGHIDSFHVSTGRNR